MDQHVEEYVKFFTKNSGSTSFEMKPFSNRKLGYLADHYLLTIYGSKTNRFFVKKFPDNTYEIMAKYIRQAKVFDKEIFVYRVLFNNFRSNLQYAPRYFYSHEDRLLILEDLTDSGFELVESNLDDKHLKLALEAIAQFHGDSLVYEESKSTNLLQDYKEYLQDGINRRDENFAGFQYTKAAHKGVLAALDNYLPKKLNNHQFQQGLQTIFDQIYTRLGPHKTYRNVCCHGDLWTRNILFKHDDNDPVDCKLVDFQLIRYSIPANDLIYFLLHSTTTEEHWDNYIHEYHQQLSLYLSKYDAKSQEILPLEELLVSCKYVTPPLRLKYAYQVMISAANSTRYMEEVYKDPKKYTETLFEDRTHLVKTLMREDEGYRKAVTDQMEILENLVVNEL